MAKSLYKEWVNTGVLEDKLLLVQGWARDGLDNQQIAHNLGISSYTLYEYQKKYTNFAQSLKRGKEVIDLEVENALLKRALGFTYIEKTTETFPDGSQKVKEVNKVISPDVTAQIYWLKNRKPQVWRERQIETEKGNGILDDLKKYLGGGNE